jgi:hypothetical protein
MASLLNNASLLLNPAGSIIAYEEDKIFSVLPSNGTGDFTFSGGDGGTRVNQQGYIEQTPANLVLNSEIFSSGWNLGATTITSNSVIAPNGTLTADSFSSNSGVAAHVVYQFFPSINGTYTFSCYVKKVNSRYVEIKIAGSAVNWVAAVFDLDTATVTKSQASNWTGLTTTITNIGDGWYRFSISGTGTTDGSFNAGIQYVDSATPTFATNYADVIVNGSGVVDYYIWGAQLNIGSTALPYQPTTDRLNYPRITYQNGRGALMGELQRTNYVLYSNSCAWSTQVGASLTFSSSISPDGTQNATTLNVGTGNYSGTYYYVNRGSEKAIVSIFAKAGTLPYLYFLNTAGNTAVAWYDLRNGTVSNVNGSYSAYMEPYKDGWYRCVLIGPTQNNIYIQIGATDISGNFAASYAGNIQIWGGQNESGTFDITYATSYIPTTTATVTRPSDIPDVSGVSSLVGQSSGGTLYVSGVPRASEQEFAAITPGGYSTVDGVYIYFAGGNNLRLYVVGGNTVQIGGNAATINVGQYFKAAVRYGNGSTAYYVNGQQIVTTSAALAFSNTLNRIDLRGNAYYYSNPGAQEISTVATYTSGLTNTQLAELTTVRSGSGGNISYYGPYTIHTFTGSATFTPSFTGPVEVLVVAGGGGGGVCYGGGGGAGGVLYTSAYGVSAGTGITVTIGAGGTNQVNVVGNGGPGGNSVFGGLTAIGGGYGGGVCGNIGGNGGSGGGGSGTGGSSTNGGLGIAGQGNNGNSSIVDGGGGGGGAGTGGLSVNRQGGNGLPYSITGFSNYYGGGGSGGGGTLLDGGLGGGGKGGIALAAGVADATPYTGGGGGGSIISGTGISGLGGAGIVIVRYLT